MHQTHVNIRKTLKRVLTNPLINSIFVVNIIYLGKIPHFIHKKMLPYPHSPPQVVPPYATHSKLSFYCLFGRKPFQEHGICCNFMLWNHLYKSSDAKYSNSRRNVQRNDQIGTSTCSCQILLECLYILKREMSNG
jgi:hypothetical protein